MRQFFPGFLLAATLVVPNVGWAQELHTWPSTGWPTRHAPILPAAQEMEARPSALSPVLGGVLAGSVGLIAGAFAGGSLAEDGLGSWPGCETDDVGCLLGSILLGAAIGESVALPVGVHLGGGRRGPFGLELLASVGIAAAGVAVTAATVQPAWLIPVPILQLWAVTAMERR